MGNCRLGHPGATQLAAAVIQVDRGEVAIRSGSIALVLT